MKRLNILTGFITTVETVNDRMGKFVAYLVCRLLLEKRQEGEHLESADHVRVLVYEVVMRYGFNSPTIWAHETSCMLYGAHFILGGAYALRHNAFVNVEVFYIKFPKRVKAIVDLFTWTMFYAFVGVMLWKSLPWAWESLKVNEFSDSTWGPLLWPIKWTIPIAAVFMLLQGIEVDPWV